MTNEQFRRILYAIRRNCDEYRTPFDLRVAKIANEVDDALETLRRETDTALTVEKERNYEENGDCIYA